MNQVTRRNFVLTTAAAAAALGAIEQAQAQGPQYGTAVNLDQAKKAIAIARSGRRGLG